MVYAVYLFYSSLYIWHKRFTKHTKKFNITKYSSAIKVSASTILSLKAVTYAFSLSLSWCLFAELNFVTTSLIAIPSSLFDCSANNCLHFAMDDWRLSDHSFYINLTWPSFHNRMFSELSICTLLGLGVIVKTGLIIFEVGVALIRGMLRPDCDYCWEPSSPT